MDYSKRIALAQKRHPEIFSGSVVDCCVQHDEWCHQLSGGRCNCVPDVTITAPSGKYRVNRKGACEKLGAEGETIPTVYDPRPSDTN